MKVWLNPPINRHTVLQHLRRKLLAGFVAVVPVAVTLFVASLLYQFVYNMIGPVVTPMFGPLARIPGVRFLLIILLGVLIVYLFGLLSTQLVTQNLLALTERQLQRIPLFRTIYGMTKQMINLVMNKETTAFKRLVLVDYPRVGVHTLAFATGETYLASDPRLHVIIFVPTPPNPTSGFIIFLPESEVQDVDIPMDEGIKLIMTGGVLTPAHLPLKPYQVMRRENGVAPQPVAK